MVRTTPDGVEENSRASKARTCAADTGLDSVTNTDPGRGGAERSADKHNVFVGPNPLMPNKAIRPLKDLDNVLETLREACSSSFRLQAKTGDSLFETSPLRESEGITNHGPA